MTYIEQFPIDFREKFGDPKANIKKWKELARHGVPDGMKRKFILAYFEIDPVAARNQYALVKSIAGEEFV